MTILGSDNRFYQAQMLVLKAWKGMFVAPILDDQVAKTTLGHVLLYGSICSMVQGAGDWFSLTFSSVHTSLTCPASHYFILWIQ